MSGPPRASRSWVVEFVLLGAIWGSSFLFMQLAVGEFGAVPTAGLRVAIASLCLLPLLWMQGQVPALRQHWKAVFLVGVLNSGLPFACFAFALLYLTTGLSAILNATVPLFGALVAWVWLKDRPAGLRIVGLAIGFAGVVLLASDKAGIKATATGPSGFLQAWAPPWASGPACWPPCATGSQPATPSATSVGCLRWSPPPAASWAPPWPWPCRRWRSGRPRHPA